MRVGIKYCGGCDPTYDRVKYVQEIQEAGVGRIEWVRFDEPGIAVVLLVCGCDAQCIEDVDFQSHDLPLVSIRSENESPEMMVSMLLEKGGES